MKELEVREAFRSKVAMKLSNLDEVADDSVEVWWIKLPSRSGKVVGECGESQLGGRQQNRRW